MTTPLRAPLKREIDVEGVTYTLTIDPQGLKLVAKGRRKGQALSWSALVNGDAALATALTASLAAAPMVAPKAPPTRGRKARG